MFILNQDKTGLFNLNIAPNIYISKATGAICIYFANKRCEVLGIYETPEHAQEVLSELCLTIANGNTKLFEMPEKQRS